MLKTDDGTKYSGRFQIDGQALDGDLTFNGSRTNLHVHSQSFFRPDHIEDRCVKGLLHDLTKVSLIECLADGAPGSSRSSEGSYWFSDIEPHFVVHGRRHLGPSEKAIKAITFGMSDAHLIFQDYDSFSSAFDVRQEQIRPFVREYEKVAKRKIPTGQRPIAVFFTGREQLIRAKTEIGIITISHRPWASGGSSRGIEIKNHIWFKIRFEELVDFDTAISAVFPLLDFMEIIAGRKQEISQVGLTLNMKDRVKRHLGVYWAYPPKRRADRTDRNPHVTDLPIDGIRERRLFTTVLENWIAVHEDRRLARRRFSEGFSQENSFDTDRLIGAANMFDLLPDSLAPKEEVLPAALKAAHDESKRLFKELPPSAEQESILIALKRLKSPNLKSKIRHRAKPIIETWDENFPRLGDVLDLGVDARNYFVHGGKPKYDFTGELEGYIPFLTMTLEYVFAVSDLHEAGWPIQNLAGQGTIRSHPFGSFRASYAHYVSGLKSALPATHPLNKDSAGATSDPSQG